MTKEEKDLKDLLLKDLCARLPYGVKIHIGKTQRIEEFGDINLRIGAINNTYADVKPYLFPLSSMTEEHMEEFYQLLELELKAINDEIDHVQATAFEVDFYNKHHLDWRGLIPKGLAIDATGLNIY